MNTLETLKSNLISDIMKSTNERLLLALSDVFKSSTLSNSTLTAAQIEMLQMGLEDIEHGRVISAEEIALEDEKWMK